MTLHARSQRPSVDEVPSWTEASSNGETHDDTNHSAGFQRASLSSSCPAGFVSRQEVQAALLSAVCCLLQQIVSVTEEAEAEGLVAGDVWDMAGPGYASNVRQLCFLARALEVQALCSGDEHLVATARIVGPVARAPVLAALHGGMGNMASEGGFGTGCPPEQRAGLCALTLLPLADWPGFVSEWSSSGRWCISCAANLWLQNVDAHLPSV